LCFEGLCLISMLHQGQKRRFLHSLQRGNTPFSPFDHLLHFSTWEMFSMITFIVFVKMWHVDKPQTSLESV
jgi:hypothetical protein